jgi:hypothetical protein
VNVTSSPPPTAPTAPTPLDAFAGSRDSSNFRCGLHGLRLLIDEISFFESDWFIRLLLILQNVDVSIIELRRALVGAFVRKWRRSLPSFFRGMERRVPPHGCSRSPSPVKLIAKFQKTNRCNMQYGLGVF